LFDELLRVQVAIQAERLDHGARYEHRADATLRPENFVPLRDVATRYRREWAERHLARYVETRWRGELTAAHQEYQRARAVNHRSPTARAVARKTEATVNRWFGGNLAGLYEAIGEHSPVRPKRAPRLIDDPLAHCACALERLRVTLPASTLTPDEHMAQCQMLLRHVLPFWQMHEALRRPPTVSEYGRKKLTWNAQELGIEPDDLWAHFTEALVASASDVLH
jgi:hypothetical protein